MKIYTRGNFVVSSQVVFQYNKLALPPGEYVRGFNLKVRYFCAVQWEYEMRCFRVDRISNFIAKTTWEFIEIGDTVFLIKKKLYM